MFKQTKYCFVPCCPNNTKNAPDKIFLTVPRGCVGEAWFKTLKVVVTGSRSTYCCEDHFNLSEDSENWCEHKLIGTKLRLKKNVVPHKYIIEPPKTKLESQLTETEKKRKEEAVAAFEQTRASSSKLSLEEEEEILFEEETVLVSVTSTKRDRQSEDQDELDSLQPDSVFIVCG